MRDKMMKFRSCVVAGLVLSMAMTHLAIAQSAGSAAPSAAAAPGTSQGNVSAKGDPDVDYLFAQKGKGAKATGANSALRSISKVQPQSRVDLKPSTGDIATSNVRTGTPSNKAVTGSGQRAEAALPAALAGGNTAAANRSAVNGATLVRPAARGTVVGGSIKNTASVLSGNSFAPKHP